MDELPREVAIELGRIMYHAAHVDYYLGRLVPATDGEPRSLGLSGQQLIKKLDPLTESNEEVARIVAGYGEQYEWRNRLVHGTHHFNNGVLWTWHVPVKGKGAVAHSYQLSSDQLRRLADSWQNLATAAHVLLHESTGTVQAQAEAHM